MPARFFVDENDLALGKALAEEHGAVVYPGHPDLPEIPRGARDDEWRAPRPRVRAHRQEEPDDRRKPS